MFCFKQVMIGTSKNIWGFDPRSVGGCVVWLDGADQSSMTFSGSSITQWNDKSGNGFNATIASGRIGATFSSVSNCVYFQASNVGYQTNYPANPTNETMFIVANIDSPSSTNNNTLIGGQLGARSLGVGWSGSADATRCAYLNNEVVWQTATPSGSYTAGTRALITGQVSTGTTQSIAMNGAAFTTATSGSAYNSSTFTYLGVDTTTTAYYYKGFVMEIIFYNSLLSTSQRQQVEGYLANKWGIQTSMPTTHPFFSLKPHLRTFQPSDFSGLSVWFDAADTPTITGTSTVTAWRDKSTNSWNATTLIGTAPTNTTVNGLNAVSFAGGSTLTVSNVAFSSVQSRAVFVVYRVPTSTPNYISWFSTQWSGGNNQGGHNNLVYPSGGGGPFLQSYAVGGAVQFISTDVAPSTIGTTAQCAMIHSALSTISNVVTLNGTSYLLSLSMIASGYSTSTVTYYIGNSYPQPYILCEYIMYQREFTQTERQQVEGYLAHKWGTTSTLPSTHPFKTFPSSSALPFLPTNVSRCALWLDPTDTTTVTLNGGNVSQLNDKSGLGYNMSQATAGNQPTYSTSLNGNRMLTFTQASSTRLSNTSFPAFIGSGPASYFLVEYNMSSPTGNAGPFGYSAGANFGIIMQYNAGYTGGLQPFSTGVSSFTSATPRLIFLYKPNVTSSNMTGFINGTSQTVSDTTSGTYSGTFSVGSAPNGFVSGNICELIVFNTSLTTAQRQQVEGYLSWKWGLQTSLPTTHPYYKFSPSFELSLGFTSPETIVKSGATTYHVFVSTGTFTTTTRTVNYLFVGGGGGGADRHGGGGGAGGVQSGTWSAAAGSYTVTVGAGGAGGNYENNNSTPRGSGLKGGDTTISGVNTAYGGGGGGTYDGNPTGTFGSGGGGGFSLAGIAGTAGQGNSGGAGGNPGGGGGGGRGGAGGAANSGTGGIGTTAHSATLLAVGYGTAFAIPVEPNTVISGGVAYIAGGGGGPSGASPGPGGLGGLGGGGRGDWDNKFISTGTPNTGGGGGGTRSESGASSAGAPGGSGLVILWY